MEHRKLYEHLEKELAYIDADIAYMEELDLAFNRDYTKLVRTKKIITKTMKKLKRIEGLR